MLVAEQFFAAGCELLVSVTSAGQITPRGAPSYFVLIDEALRDEGTSEHYLPPSLRVTLGPTLRNRIAGGFSDVPVPVHTGASWTTDAPYHETAMAIAAARKEGLLAVEIEAAALYAFAQARERPVVCFAHITNEMAVAEGDFEKGEANGTDHALALVAAAVNAAGAPHPEGSPERDAPASKPFTSREIHLWRSSMNVYTYSEARQRLSDVLEEAERTGEVRIKRRGGGEFALRPVRREASPFEAAGAAVQTREELTPQDLVDAVRVGRSGRSY